MKKIAMIAVAMWPMATQAIECQSSMGNAGHWMWRQIDNKKCWYLGNKLVAKSELYWPVAESKPVADDSAIDPERETLFRQFVQWQRVQQPVADASAIRPEHETLFKQFLLWRKAQQLMQH